MVVHLAIELSRRGHQVTVASLFERLETDLDEALVTAEVPAVYIGKSRGFSPKALARLNSVVMRLRADVIHTHQYILGYTLPSLGCLRSAAKVHTVHTLAEREVGAVGRLAARLAFSLGTIPVAVSQEVARSIRRLYPGREPLVVANGILVDRYSRPRVPRGLWRHLHGVAPEEVMWVSVASLTPAKNHALLLRAFARATTIMAGLRLVLVGDGPLRRNLERLSSELGVGGQVKFIGFSRDVPSVLGAADAFVLASDWEGSPLAVLEAMAAGLPVVATAVGGIAEVVENGITGLLVRRGDATALARAMITLSQNPALRRRLGEAGKDRARRLFSVEVMASGYEKLYLSLLNRL